MKILIEESLNKNIDWIDKPLRYRMSLSFYDDIVLKREYFKVGFLDGEENDKFHSHLEKSVKYISFITQNFDEKYLQEKENELFKNAYEYILKSKKNWKKYITEQIKLEQDEQKKKIRFDFKQ